MRTIRNFVIPLFAAITTSGWWAVGVFGVPNGVMFLLVMASIVWGAVLANSLYEDFRERDD